MYIFAKLIEMWAHVCTLTWVTFNRSNSLPVIIDSYAELSLKSDATKERFNGLW